MSENEPLLPPILEDDLLIEAVEKKTKKRPFKSDREKNTRIKPIDEKALNDTIIINEPTQSKELVKKEPAFKKLNEISNKKSDSLELEKVSNKVLDNNSDNNLNDNIENNSESNIAVDVGNVDSNFKEDKEVSKDTSKTNSKKASKELDKVENNLSELQYEVGIEEVEIVEPDAILINIDDIFELDNFREEIEDLEELSASIKARGLLHPVVVREAPLEAKHVKKYELVVGYRRFNAFKTLGKPQIPALITKSDDQQTLANMITENLQRKGWGPIAEARAMHKMLEVFGWTQKEVAAELGVHPSQVSKRISLLDLPDAVKELVESQEITVSHAEVLISLEKPEAQEEMAQLAAKSGASVHKLNSWANKVKAQEEEAEKLADKIEDENVPLEAAEDYKITQLPVLNLKKWDNKQHNRALLYMLLRSANDVELLEYLEEKVNVDDDTLYEFVLELEEEKVSEYSDIILQRWYKASHRYETFSKKLKEDLAYTEDNHIEKDEILNSLDDEFDDYNDYYLDEDDNYD